MSILINMEMPPNCSECAFCGYYGNGEHMCDIIEKAVEYESAKTSRHDNCPLIPVPPHGDLIDRDALIKDGWLNLHKEVMRMGGYAVHELPLKNPSIPVIIPADKEGGV